MGGVVTTREVNAIRLLIICTELLLSCGCAVLLAPLEGQCWRAVATPVQMAASGGIAVVNIGRLVALVTGDALPACVERAYLLVSAALFAAAGGLALAAEQPAALLWDAAPWDSRETGRGTLALLTLLLLLADAAVSCLQAARASAPPPPALLDVSAEEPPPSYAAAVATARGLRPHCRACLFQTINSVIP